MAAMTFKFRDETDIRHLCKGWAEENGVYSMRDGGDYIKVNSIEGTGECSGFSALVAAWTDNDYIEEIG